MKITLTSRRIVAVVCRCKGPLRSREMAWNLRCRIESCDEIKAHHQVGKRVVETSSKG